MAAQSIMLGQGDVFVAGGVESMSRVPMGGFNPSFNPKLINNPRASRSAACRQEEHGLHAVLHPDGHDGGESRTRVQHQPRGSGQVLPCAATSAPSRRSITASSPARSSRSTLPNGELFTTDEGPRRDTSLERLAALEPAFIAGGSVTAGNSSPLNDGASGVVLMSAEKASELGIQPRARILSMAVAGVAPTSWASDRSRPCKQGAASAPTFSSRRHRHHRAERGVRRAVAGRRSAPSASTRSKLNPAWRRHCARASARLLRLRA